MTKGFWSTSFLLLLLLSSLMLEYSMGYKEDPTFFPRDVVYKRNDSRTTNIRRTLQTNNNGVTILPRPNLNVFDVLLQLNDSKKAGVYTYDDNNTPILTKFHYLIQPVWWSDLDTTNPSFRMNAPSIQPTLERVKRYYRQMSFGLFELEWTILDQAVLPGVSSVNPGFDETETNTRSLLNSKGFVEGIDFDGIMLLYFTSQNGPFSGAGGWGGVNDNFLWMSYNSRDSSPIDYSVTRHEIGHNFGHPHHHSNKYWYRKYRPQNPEDVDGDDDLGNNWYDGFDMMSYGNGFEVSHFSVASKWFFNWVPSESVVVMHPDGATETCPSCRSEGTFTLKPFDDSTISPNKDDTIMGIHIPITAIGSSTLDRYFSYWLSYRTGVEGNAAKGLSVHLTWFSNLGGAFGASYDSLNYDAHGNTDTVFDSFVLEGTCYHISPASKLKDYDSIGPTAIQPVVCVDNVNVGSDITISVSFLDPNNPPMANVDVNEASLECSLSGANLLVNSLDVSRANLIHVLGTGRNGAIALSNLCPDSSDTTASMTAYFYDSYPYSPLAYNSPPAYGSFQSLTVTALDCQRSVIPSLTYQSEFGNTWIFVVKDNGDFSQSTINLSCSIQDCGVNQVLQEGKCVTPQFDQCPDGTVWAEPGSNICYTSNEFESVFEANGWRVWSTTFQTEKDWVLDINELEIYDTIDCSGSPISPALGSSVESGNAGSGWGAENAFDSSPFSVWGGRPDPNGVFYLGKVYTTDTNVRCVKVSTEFGKGFKEMYIQAKVEDEWVNVWKEEGLVGGETITVSLNFVPNATPTMAPTSLTVRPTPVPTMVPTVLTARPTPVPTVGPTILTANPTPYVSNDFQPVSEARGWRVWATIFQTEQDWLLDITELEFYDTLDCSGSPINPALGVSVESGNAGSGWGAENAFDSTTFSAWGGRPDSDGIFYLGKVHTTEIGVRCVRVTTEYGKGFQEMYIQAKVEDEWVNVWKEEGMVGGDTITVSLNFEPSPTPPPVQVEPPLFCFSGSNNVTVKGKGSILMKDLEIGDHVLGANHEYEAIYSFGHYNSTIFAEYLRIRILLPSSLTTVLEISKSHMMHLENGDIRPASFCDVGTKVLLLKGDSGQMNAGKIMSIQPVISKGAYAPFTASGTLVVNGVVASIYVSFGDDHSGSLQLAGGYLALSFQWLAHIYETPHRLFCQGACYGETYNEDGISTWNVVPLHYTQWLLQQPNSIVMVIMLPVLASLGILSLLELILSSSAWLKMLIFACGLIVITQRVRRHNRKLTP